MPIELKAEAVKLFAEVGFLGLGCGRVEQSAVIFDMLIALRPAEEVGAIGAALTELAAKRPDSAVKVLKTAAQTPAVMAFSAMAHARLGDTVKAKALIEDLEAMDAEPALLELAQGALGRG